MNGYGKGRSEAAGAPNAAIVEYLSTKKTQGVLRFLLTHLGVSRPEDPVAFLSDLLNRGLESRRRADQEQQGPPPAEDLSLFQGKHIEALLNAMDPFRKGVISTTQYHNGMCTMGLVDYNREPPVDEDGYVARGVFLQEA